VPVGAIGTLGESKQKIMDGPLHKCLSPPTGDYFGLDKRLNRDSIQLDAGNVYIITTELLWWDEVEWLQEPQLQSKKTRQGGVRRNNQTTKQRIQAHQRGLQTITKPL
jgi:hypothetical protein